jgi:hypothetical protein
VLVCVAVLFPTTTTKPKANVINNQKHIFGAWRSTIQKEVFLLAWGSNINALPVLQYDQYRTRTIVLTT